MAKTSTNSQLCAAVDFVFVLTQVTVIRKSTVIEVVFHFGFQESTTPVYQQPDVSAKTKKLLFVSSSNMYCFLHR